jgi:Uma2 family endonuclease
LDKNPIGEIIPGPGIVFDIHNSVMPDLVYIRRERSEAINGIHLTEAPDLIIEVLWPGSENIARDRKMKRQLYGKRGVKEYWILDPQMRTIESMCLASKTRQAIAARVSASMASRKTRQRRRRGTLACRLCEPHRLIERPTTG